MGSYPVHNVRFYVPDPRAINCMTFQEKIKKLAVSRIDASIEIWNLVHTPYIERTIASSANNSSVEGLVWCGTRLFAVGLHGFLIEYDLFTLGIKQMAAVTGEEAYCIDSHVSSATVAVGTEKGYLNIFSIENDELLFNKFLDKQEGKIICFKYDPSGKFIVSGSADTIRVWDVDTGHAIHRMTTGRSEANKPTIIWSLAITVDLTIITGDSRGKLTFWDGNVGAQLESYQSHQADILSVFLSKDENTLYCAGVDPNIMSYAKITVKGDAHKWVKSIQRKVHDHDVRSLVMVEDRLYSAGDDGYLACSYHPPKTLLKYPPLKFDPVMLARKARMVLLRYPEKLVLWRMSTYLKNDENSDFRIEKQPKMLLSLARTIKIDNKIEERYEEIVCSAISSDGRLIFYSTETRVSLFYFNTENEDKLILSRVTLPRQCTKTINAIFSKDSQLILAPNTGGLQVLDIRKEGVEIVQTIEVQGEMTDIISHLCISPCETYLVAADPNSNIVVWKHNGNEWKKYCKLPRYNSVPTAMAIQQKNSNLIVTYSDHKVVEYCLPKQQFTKFSRRIGDSNMRWVNKNYPVRHIACDPSNEDVIVMHDDSCMVVIDKSKKLPEPDAKIPKLDPFLLSSDSNDGSQFRHQEHAFHGIKKYKHLVHLDWLAENEMVAVEVSPLALAENLPPAFDQKTYGTK